MAAAAFILLPCIGAAQSSVLSAQDPAAVDQASRIANTLANQDSPRFHLDEAKKALDGISILSLSGETARQVTLIKTSFTNLYNDYTRTAPNSSAGNLGSLYPPPIALGTSGSMSALGLDWHTEYTQISQALDRLNIPTATSPGAPARGSSSGAGSGVTGTSGSGSGMSSGYGASIALGADVRKRLADFRRHLDRFNSLAS